jgi:RNA polymerase sigma-70 factor (ECF subfamily)
MIADRESSEWLRTLSAGGAEQEAAEARLHRLLIRVAASELHRRRTQLDVSGPELDDMAYQAAADALVSITARLGRFRGESRFTTWACKFAIFEVSAKVGRHFWRRPHLPYDSEDWEALPDRFGLDVAEAAEARELVAALRAAVEDELSERQRTAFVAIVLNGIPADALAVQLGSNRNAIYKTLFDARRKLRTALAESGHLDPKLARRP